MKIYILAFIAGLLMTTTTWAESAGDFRYNIRGYVLDENRQAISSQDVRVYKGRLLLEMVKTDMDGFYSIQLKLRDSDNKRAVKISTGKNEAEIRITYDPEDLTKPQVHKVNFIAGKLIEGRLSHYLIPPWIYPIVGLIVIFFIALKLEKRRKKKIQLKKDKLSGKQPISGHHSKKKWRKKH